MAMAAFFCFFLFFFHTASSSQQTDMAAVSSSFYSCSCCLACTALPPAPKLHNTTSRCRKHRQACLINMDWLPGKAEGCWETHSQWEATVHLNIYCCRPIREQYANTAWSYSWVSKGEKRRLCSSSHPIEPDGISLQKANTKEALGPAAGLEGWV